jgi:hypothetical protein
MAAAAGTDGGETRRRRLRSSEREAATGPGPIDV